MNMRFASSENVDVRKNIILFLILSFILFFFDKSENKYFKVTRSIINDAVVYSTVLIKLPFDFVLDTTSSVSNFFEKEETIKKSELINLQNEVESLKNEKTTLLLQLRNLKKITGEENYEFKTLKTKVLIYKSNIISEAITVNKGSSDGVTSGDPLIKNNLLVGKITNVNFNSSNGILITNISSRVPVRIGEKNYNAIAVGNSGLRNKLNLEFLPKEYSFNEGDFVYTTSIDKIMPDGILIGKIKKDINNIFYVEPLYDFSQIDYLTIVKMKK